MNKKNFLKSDKMEKTIQKIAELREEAASMLTVNNAIVDQIGEIEEKLLDPSNRSNPERLQEQKNKLKRHLEEKKYSETIDALKQEIYDLEVEAFGKSDMLSKSPAPGNCLI